MRRRALQRIASGGAVAAMTTWTATQCDINSDNFAYYGVAGGIGTRVGLDESGATAVPGCAIVRLALLQETHENLRRWATAANWAEATRRHKAAFYDRYENLEQESLVETIRAHYHSFVSSTAASNSQVDAALFRCEDDAFGALTSSIRVTGLPDLITGIYDEKIETCIVDFANKRLGGAWLSYGMVQEEKLFIERPDLGALCARALVDMPAADALPGSKQACPFSMDRNEAWVFRGAPAYASLDCYGRIKPGWSKLLTLLDPADDRPTCPTIVAIDSIKASPARGSGIGGFECYERRHLEMMTLKGSFARIQPVLRVPCPIWPC